jgi:hypothetical protein
MPIIAQTLPESSGTPNDSDLVGPRTDLHGCEVHNQDKLARRRGRVPAVRVSISTLSAPVFPAPGPCTGPSLVWGQLSPRRQRPPRGLTQRHGWRTLAVVPSLASDSVGLPIHRNSA